jgi:hypothetical protein
MDMDNSTRWGLPRYLTLVGVLAVHFALLAAIFMVSRTQAIARLMDDPVEVQFYPPNTIPKIRADSSRMRGFNGDHAISVTPPVLASSAPALPSSGADDGSGAGVDWKAEARRAVQAYEIRKNQPLDSLLTGSPAEENWWPRTRHHAGEQFKTPSGDWIVWIDSDCYQIASASGNSYAPGPRLTETICVNDPKPRQGGSAVTH